MSKHGPLSIQIDENTEAVRIGTRALKNMVKPQRFSESWRIQTKAETLTQVTLFGPIGDMIHWRSTTPSQFHTFGDKLAILRNANR